MMQYMTVLGLTYLISHIVASFFRFEQNIFIFVIVVISILFITLLKHFENKKIVLACLLFVAFSFGTTFMLQQQQSKLFSQIENKTLNFSGVVVSKQVNNDMNYYLVRLSNIENKKLNSNYTVGFKSKARDNINLFEKINAEAEFFPYTDTEAFLDFKKAKNYVADLVINEKSIKLLGTQKGFEYFSAKLQNQVKEKIEKFFGYENASLLKGILIGERSDIKPTLTIAFRRTGLSHIMVVSGLNLLIIIQFFMMIFKFLRIPLRVNAFINVFLIVAFIFLAGFSASIIRAGIMALCMLSTIIFRKSNNSVAHLFFAVILILAITPNAIFDISFWLSFSATLGVLVLNPKLKNLALTTFNIKNYYLKEIIELAAVSTSAYLFVMPISIFCFKELSLVAIPINILLDASFSIILSFGFVFLFFSQIFFLDKFSALFADFINYLINLNKAIISTVAKYNFASIRLDDSSVIIIFIMLVFVFSIYLIIKNNMLRLKLSLFCFVIALTGIITNVILNNQLVKVVNISTYYTNSIVIIKNDSAIVVGCGGDNYIGAEVSKYLVKNNVLYIDYFISPKSSSQYIGQLNTLFNFKINNIIAPLKGNEINDIKKQLTDNTRFIDYTNLKVLYNKNFFLDLNGSGVCLNYFNTSINFSTQPSFEKTNFFNSPYDIVLPLKNTTADYIILSKDKNVFSNSKLIKENKSFEILLNDDRKVLVKWTF